MVQAKINKTEARLQSLSPTDPNNYPKTKDGKLEEIMSNGEMK